MNELRHQIETEPRSRPGALQVAYVTIDESSEGQRIDNFLLKVAKGVPKSHIYRVLRSGEVRVNKGRIDATIAFGVSQSGRFLRDFVKFGFNQDEDGHKVFDGVLSHIAGIGGVVPDLAVRRRVGDPSAQAW